MFAFTLFYFMNNAAINICIQAFVWMCTVSLGYSPKCGIAGLHGNSVLKCLRDWKNVFLKWWNNFIFYHQYIRILISPYSCPQLLLSLCSGITVVLICISLMTYDVQHMLIGHWCIFFRILPIHTFYLFLFGL
jgi:hypothetical protein